MSKDKSAEEVVAEALMPQKDAGLALQYVEDGPKVVAGIALKALEQAGFTVARLEEIKGLSYPLRVYRKVETSDAD